MLNATKQIGIAAINESGAEYPDRLRSGTAVFVNQGIQMIRLFKILSFVICFSLQLGSPDLSAQENSRPLFNGTNFDGWVRTNTPAKTWTYQDGMVICSGRPIGEIRTAKMYQNFIMELEWRHMVPRGNAGVFVWADDITSRGVPFHRGIEVQVLENAYGNNRSHTTHGDIFPIHGATMTPINGHGGSRAFPTENRSKPSPEWNHYRIECRDGEISLAVNGKVVTRGKDCVPRKGYICLESEGGIVHYRNVRITELPETKITDQQIAISDRGYMSIYNGLDLEGWKATADSLWKANDWTLKHDASPEQASRLETTDEMESTRFVIDVKLKDKQSRAVIAIGGLNIDLAKTSKGLEPTGRWNRIEAIADGEAVRVEINGQPAMQETTSLKGKISLQASGPVDFSNVYIAPREDE
ncbi:MAG: 3-keto-disaccharide hydrolase [Rubripirellula sp.]